MSARLTDDELRAAAARRPGYATYPEYRPGQRERLGRLPLASGPAGHSTTRTISAVTAPAVPSGPAPVSAVPPVIPPTPITVTLASLPATPVFDFTPRLITVRPWWRRRWHWGVLAAGGRMQYGYAWTEAGARLRTARATRSVARR